MSCRATPPWKKISDKPIKTNIHAMFTGLKPSLSVAKKAMVNSTDENALQYTKYIRLVRATPGRWIRLSWTNGLKLRWAVC